MSRPRVSPIEWITLSELLRRLKRRTAPDLLDEDADEETRGRARWWRSLAEVSRKTATKKIQDLHKKYDGIIKPGSAEKFLINPDRLRAIEVREYESENTRENEREKDVRKTILATGGRVSAVEKKVQRLEQMLAVFAGVATGHKELRSIVLSLVRERDGELSRAEADERIQEAVRALDLVDSLLASADLGQVGEKNGKSASKPNSRQKR